MKNISRIIVAFIAMFVIMCSFSIISVAAAPAEDTAAPVASETQQKTDPNKGMAFIASALAIGLAGIGGGIAIAAGAPAAIGATSEDPKNFGKALIFVALGEAIALYGFLISFLIYSVASKM